MMYSDFKSKTIALLKEHPVLSNTLLHQCLFPSSQQDFNTLRMILFMEQEGLIEVKPDRDVGYSYSLFKLKEASVYEEQ